MYSFVFKNLSEMYNTIKMENWVLISFWWYKLQVKKPLPSLLLSLLLPPHALFLPHSYSLFPPLFPLFISLFPFSFPHSCSCCQSSSNDLLSHSAWSLNYLELLKETYIPMNIKRDMHLEIDKMFKGKIIKIKSQEKYCCESIKRKINYKVQFWYIL